MSAPYPDSDLHSLASSDTESGTGRAESPASAFRLTHETHTKQGVENGALKAELGAANATIAQLQLHNHSLEQHLAAATAALQTLSHDHEETVRRLASSHEETIGKMTQDREETGRRLVQDVAAVMAQGGAK